MANPTPQHNPTDGLGTACLINLSASNSGLTIFSTTVANKLYSVPLSVSAAGTYTATIAVSSQVKDIAATNFTSGNGNSVIWKSYDTSIATVSAGTITAVKAGQVTIEAQFATFDNTAGTNANTGNPWNMIYSQILVQVIP